ncbi:unnamed protein product, partial [Lepidochelys kempii]
ILWCQQLAKDQSKLCVFAPEGETIKDALYKDGRFYSCLEKKEWQLVENKKYRPSNYCVDNLANRSFEVVVKTKPLPWNVDCSNLQLYLHMTRTTRVFSLNFLSSLSFEQNEEI